MRSLLLKSFGAKGRSTGRWRAILAFGLAVAGCQREEIRVDQVPKESTPAATAAPATGSLPAPLAAPEIVRWQLPAGWEELPPGEMRVGYFRVQGRDGQQALVTIIPLPGAAGGELDNVNRWRSQVGQGPVSAADLAKQAEPVTIAGTSARMFDVAGIPPETNVTMRILAASLPRQGTTWFFKMTGSDLLVKEEKGRFQELLKSVAFGPPAETASTSVPAPVPAPLPKLEPPPSSAPDSTKPTWTMPAAWKEQAPGSMQIARFAVPEADTGKAEVTVTAFPGDVGGLLANVNRWRSQIGLAALDASSLTNVTATLDLNGAPATLVDLTNATTQKRLLTAVVPRGGQTWFYKVVGDARVVEREKTNLLEFVRSVR